MASNPLLAAPQPVLMSLSFAQSRELVETFLLSAAGKVRADVFCSRPLSFGERSIAWFADCSRERFFTRFVALRFWENMLQY